MGSIGIGCSEAQTMAIDLGDLTAFVAVTRGGGFRPAAGASGGSASSFSEALSRLGARLGVPLLNRTTRSVTPDDGKTWKRMNLELDVRVPPEWKIAWKH